MRIDSTGFVGIGTTTPNYLLSISGASGADGATPITLQLNSTTNSAWTDEAIMAQLLFDSADTSGSAGTRGAIKSYLDDTTGNDLGLSFWTTTAGGGGIAERMRIDHSGNVGIGLIDPQTQLVIAATS